MESPLLAKLTQILIQKRARVEREREREREREKFIDNHQVRKVLSKSERKQMKGLCQKVVTFCYL